MFCTNCGTENSANAGVCRSCGEVLRQGGQGQSFEQIPNYLVHSILVTIFCCLPFGIVSIVYAAQVNGKIQAGDIAGAREASENAKKWCTYALIFGIVGTVAVLALQMFAAAAA